MTEGREFEGLRLEAHRRADLLADEWDVLADELLAPPFARPGWVLAWARAFSAGGVRALAVRREGRLVGLLPFARRRGVASAPVNWHTPVFSFLAADASVRRALAYTFISCTPVRADLSFLDSTDPNLGECREAAGRLRRPTVVRTVMRSPYIEIAGVEWDAYRASLRRKDRKEIERYGRRLREQGKVAVEFVDGGSDLQRLLGEGFRIEGSGWKQARQSAITSAPATRRFYTEVAEWAHARGWLVLAFLRLDGKPIAFDLCLRSGGVTWVLKGGYDPDFRRFGPGVLLTYESLRAAFADGHASYELLGGDDPYKLIWTQTVRERVRFQAFARTVRGQVNRLAWTRGRPAVQRALAAAGNRGDRR